jgi:hypothetical protein
MLYFTENYWTLPDMMEVNEAFDREYDTAEYEKKIAQLVRHAHARTRKENPQELEDWKDAIDVLSKEDHYILVMLGKAAFRFQILLGCRPYGVSLERWSC